MRSIFGYVLAGIGLVGTAISSIKEIRGIIKFIPESLLASNSFLLVSLALVGVGIILAVSEKGTSKKKGNEEVPIYDKSGKSVVGYRRTK